MEKTKEEIFYNHFDDFEQEENYVDILKAPTLKDGILNAMQEYSDQQNQELLIRVKELEAELKTVKEDDNQDELWGKIVEYVIYQYNGEISTHEQIVNDLKNQFKIIKK